MSQIERIKELEENIKELEEELDDADNERVIDLVNEIKSNKAILTLLVNSNNVDKDKEVLI